VNNYLKSAEIEGYRCTYPGCTAQPFQTQYNLK
jgi:hypothetical protein